MATESSKSAHQQQWDYNISTGFFSLKASPSLCISVVPGCPAHTTGCVFLAECDQCQNSHGCATAFDFSPAKASPGGKADYIKMRKGGLCFEIDGHDAFQLSPLGVWACGGAFDQPNEWWNYDSEMGHLVSVQPSSSPGLFVATSCT